MSSYRSLVRVLEADPQLGNRLTPKEATDAMQLLVTELRRLNADEVHELPALWRAESGQELALLVVDGYAARRLHIEEATFVELVGPGDLVAPWPSIDATDGAYEEVITLTRTDVTLLDELAFEHAAKWPSIYENLLKRVCEQSRRLSVQLAATHIVGIERKVLTVLSHFADRWGRVNRSGVELPFALTNELLSKIVGCSTPSASVAMNKLKRDNLVVRSSKSPILLGGAEEVRRYIRRDMLETDLAG